MKRLFFVRFVHLLMRKGQFLDSLRSKQQWRMTVKVVNPVSNMGYHHIDPTNILKLRLITIKQEK